MPDTITVTPPMNPEIKAAWTAALRSRRYEQGREYLRKDGKYCCLGVLCVMAADAEVIEARPADGYYEDTYDENEGYGSVFIPDETGRWDFGQDEETLPEPVQYWAGIGGRDADNPLVRVPGEIWPRLTDHAKLAAVVQTHEINLATLNDAGVPFGVIADIVDACL